MLELYVVQDLLTKNSLKVIKKTNPRKLVLALGLGVLNLIVIGILLVSFLEIYSYQKPSIAESNEVKEIFNRSKSLVFCKQTIENINRTRAENNLQPLKSNQKLNNSAKNKMEDILKYNYFSHINPTTGKKWSNFIKEENYNYINIGENLATGYKNPENLVNDWLKSESHRENILSPKFKESGIACLKNNDSYTVVHFFGS